MYEGCKIYGPYKNNKNRLILTLTKPNKIRATLSYPRYLKELELNRYLTKEEHVHHTDHDYENNDLSNLEVISAKEHFDLPAKQLTKYDSSLQVKCCECDKEFTLTIKQRKNRDREQQRKTKKDKTLKNRFFCSKKCSGKYGKKKQIQNASVAKLANAEGLSPSV